MTDFCGVMAIGVPRQERFSAFTGQETLAKAKQVPVGRSVRGRSVALWGDIGEGQHAGKGRIQRRAEALWRHRAPVNSAEERRLTCLRRSIQLAIAGRAREMHSRFIYVQHCTLTL